MRFVYTQAIVNERQLDLEGPGAIRFRSTIVKAKSVNKAYLMGMRWAAQFVYNPQFETVNDIVVPIDEQVN